MITKTEQKTIVDDAPGDSATEQSHDTFERRIRPEVSDVPVLRHEVTQYCHAQGSSDDCCAAFELALGEALANAVQHGGRGGAADPVLSIWNYRDALIASIRDFGPGFDPPMPPYSMPAADAHRINGRGLPLMALLTDALLISRSPIDEGAGVTVYLIKRVSGK